MKKSPLLLVLALAAACGNPQKNSSSSKRMNVQKSGPVTMLVTGVENLSDLKQKANLLGIKVEGESVIVLSGDASDLNQLDISANNNFAYLEDAPLKLTRSDSFEAENEALYLAKKDFGILEFWKNKPEADGRGVIVGVLDDGISPHQQGFLTTTTGKRKFLKKGSNSSFTTFKLKESTEGLVAEIDENRMNFGELLDLNQDGEHNTWSITVDPKNEKACIDEVCKGSFSKSGEYFTLSDARLTMMVEIDLPNKTIQVFQPEKGDDSHGEGVASVLAGYRIGNLPGFDGVAPGAQIVDYDLSEISDKATETDYTISTFIKGLDWLGTNGAEVANISYSMGFTSAETQTFMQKALDEIISKHNMVVSFSAGNNGPGLGSLNRRAIYPANSLVAGAFISKELDERVHGVTGIPDEGRVVYYSSRGPGLGVGPTLISPLSSLTNSSADQGHMAFNGTSSASPALAGAAAVLISAIKQEGLKVHAPSVVHALRLSGKRLKNEPFIFQGAGLPQIEKALTIYKKLINGEVFENVTVEVIKDGLDGVSAQGVVVRASEGNEVETRRIFLKGIMSELAPADTKVNLLIPVKLEYSPGISGPNELWISSAENTLYIDINVKEALVKNDIEGFGEVRIISKLDGSDIASIPVTVINDRHIKSRPATTLKLGAQEGLRFHVYIPEGVKAFKVKAEVTEGEERNVILSVFDTNQIRVIQQRISGDMWIPVSRAGHYQIGVAISGGTKRETVVKVQAEAIELKLKSTTIEASSGVVQIENKSKSSLNAILKLTPVGEVVKSAVVSQITDEAQMKLNLAAGNYYVEMKPTKDYSLSYFYPNCSVKTKSASSESMEYEDELELTEASDVSIRCVPFDYGMDDNGQEKWIMKLYKTFESSKARLDIAPNQARDVRFENLKPGRYKVKIQDPVNDFETSLTIGEIEVL